MINYRPGQSLTGLRDIPELLGIRILLRDRERGHLGP